MFRNFQTRFDIYLGHKAMNCECRRSIYMYIAFALVSSRALNVGRQIIPATAAFALSIPLNPRSLCAHSHSGASISPSANSVQFIHRVRSSSNFLSIDESRSIRSASSTADAEREESEIPKKSPSKKVKVKVKVKRASDSTMKTKISTKSPATKRKSPTKTKTVANRKPKAEKGATPRPKKKAKAADHQRLTERDELPRLWDGEAATRRDGSYTFKIMSWNVAGLRALMRNHPDSLPNLVTKYGIDVLCLQETKLQEVHVDDPKLKISGHLLEEEGYDAYYTCSTAKKGYSGTAVFIRRRHAAVGDGKKSMKQASLSSFFSDASGEKSNRSEDGGSRPTGDVAVKKLMPTNVSFGIGKDKHDAEGRSITVDFPLFSMTALYVPNSGQKLDRLSYRTEEWDSDLLAYMQQKEKGRKCPVIWMGDLNVAHTGMEVWNEGAKHLAKSAGTTAEERASFEEQLNAGYVDAFRALHPNAKGQYTYWSQRAGNRAPNKGLRLDYFICSESMMHDGDGSSVVVRDSYIVHDHVGSDHCPIVLELEIKK